MSLMRSVLLGCGSYLPEKALTNDDLSKIVETSDEWIVQRTGICERHVAAEGEVTSALALNAARAALANAGVEADTIDLIVMATSTLDNTFPASAVTVQEGLGITTGAAFDVQAVCSGFIFAMTTADAYLRTGLAKRALVIGAETFSRIIDWTDRSTCVLFGDGAGAVVLEAQEMPGDVKSDRGVLSCHLRSDGCHKEKLYVDGGPSSTQTTGHLRMEGREVFKHAVGMVIDVIRDAFEETGTTPEDLDWFVPHQANRQIIDALAKKLGIAPEKCLITVDRQAIPRPPPFRWRSTSRSRTDASRRTISSCSRRWAAASLGARCCCAGSAPHSDSFVSDLISGCLSAKRGGEAQTTCGHCVVQSPRACRCDNGLRRGCVSAVDPHSRNAYRVASRKFRR